MTGLCRGYVQILNNIIITVDVSADLIIGYVTLRYEAVEEYNQHIILSSDDQFYIYRVLPVLPRWY